MPLPVHVLLFHAYGSGGVARTVVNLANHLADTRDVEVISLFRRRDEPRFPLDPRVRLTVLHDTRRTNPFRAGLARRPTRLRPAPSETQLSLLTDLLLRRKLGSLRDGLLLSTRPSLHLAATRYAPKGVVTVGQEHLNFPTRSRNPRQLPVLTTAVPGLDAYTVLTEADAADYRAALPGVDTDIRVIRNALPWPVADAPAPLDRKVVVAAGRLAPEKGYPRLLRAFAPLAAAHPDWELHIYGEGPERAALAARIDRLGLDGRALLMGYTDDLRGVLADASAYAMTSHSEGFPMALIEAMSVGLPPVVMDCPRGPAEIVADGRNGRLVADGDEGGFTAALRDVVERADVRRRLGAQALEDSTAYTMDRIGAQWEALFTELEDDRNRAFSRRA
ncbi:MAG: glycosyltransferase family 4 protein [Nocardioidaceae bacterium]